MAKKLAPDTSLFAITVALVGVGLLMVWSASSDLAREKHDNAYHFLIRQVLWAAVGVGLMLAGARLDYRRLRQGAVVYGALAGAALLLVVVLFLPPVNDVRRWIRVGGLSLQPAELAKLAMILFLAYHLERKQDRLNEFLPSLFPALLLLGWFAFLIFVQPDLGSAATLVAVGCVMLVVAGVKLRYFVALSVPAAGFLYQAVMAAAYRRDRIAAFLDPWSDAQRSGYQIIQSLIAVGTGGVTGVGLMESRQKAFYLPYPYSDFIYAVLAEELGLLGASALVLAFGLFLWRGMRAAFRAPDRFGTYLAAGLTLAIVVQAFVNMSVVLGLLPTKGIPLPFVSAGGSSLVLSLLSVGLILNVSQHAD